MGKSTLSVNLALAMAQQRPKAEVGLLDADVFGPSVPHMLNLVGASPQANQSPLPPLSAVGED